MAEELALEQRLGHRRAVDGDERAGLRRGPRVVQRPRDELLAVPLSPVMSTVADESATRSRSS